MKTEHWRWRWVQLRAGGVLHRVRRVDNRRDWLKWSGGTAETVCGETGKGRMWMPGVVSRMAAPRCAKCCRKLGLPRGVGAPYNDPMIFPPEGKPLRRAPQGGDPT